MQLEEHAITAPSAQLMLVALLVTLAQAEPPEGAAAESGIKTGASLLERLARLSLAEIHRLAEKGALKLVVYYDGDQVTWSLQASARRHAEQALLEYFVRHGARRTLLRELFTVSRAQIDTVRRGLRLAPVRGRPKLPGAREREAVVAAWSQLASTITDRRSRYHALHRTFPRYSIGALDAVLREVSPGRSDTPPSSGNRSGDKPVSAPHGRSTRAPAPPGRTVVNRRAPK